MVNLRSGPSGISRAIHDAYTRNQLIEMKVWILCHPGTPRLDVHGCPFLGAGWMNGPMLCKTAEPRSVSDQTHSRRLFYEGHSPSHLACCVGLSRGQLDEPAKVESFAFPGCLSFALCVQSSDGERLLNQHVVGAQTETLRRKAWNFVFPECRSHLQSGLASGLEKLAPCRLIGVRGETSDEGFMGARRSTATGSARWFPYPTITWEPPLLTWVV